VTLRPAVVLLVIAALVAGAIAIRPQLGARDEGDEAEEAIVAPSRVRSVEGEPRVVLDTAELRRIGLTTAALAAAGAETGQRLSGLVVPEPERTVALRAPVSGRLAAAEGRDWPALGERLEAGAAIARVSDAQPLAVPIGGVVTKVGARPGEIVAAGQVLLELADNSRPVVRIAWPEDAGRARDRVLLVPPAGQNRIAAALIGPAAEADPLTRLPSYLYRAGARWPGSVPGTPVTALVPTGEPIEGVLVPDRAVVQWEGFAWAYVQRAPGEFARVRVPTARPAAGGWIAGPPLAPGDTIVVAGVQELLSEEFRARVTVGEESGE
jgi:biotin carboxyl carrier protein